MEPPEREAAADPAPEALPRASSRSTGPADVPGPSPEPGAAVQDVAPGIWLPRSTGPRRPAATATGLPHGLPGGLPLIPRSPRPGRHPGRSGPSPDLVLTPRRRVHSLATGALVVAVAATAAAAVVATASGRPADAVAVAVLGLAVAALWIARARTTPVHVRLKHGLLEVRTGSHRHTFDLASPYVLVEVQGVAGRLGWELALQQLGGASVRLTAADVDSVPLTEALRWHRPTL
ncbi:hypothetical protein [Nocardioides sp. GY 10127]|uniref:hypothetical protein n=1 Tax=Nocardioides sp. GY 10127 TaxID=2569762 RepID=UPI0010A7E72F|nr:hypothetical protein [Nocardioides sp. GY 10127]TIC80146.1 hypothetical protein E8D37_16245 [Nocardioides sp. GY 10127]